jgi:hypothetical protein
MGNSTKGRPRPSGGPIPVFSGNGSKALDDIPVVFTGYTGAGDHYGTKGAAGGLIHFLFVIIYALLEILTSPCVFAWKCAMHGPLIVANWVCTSVCTSCHIGLTVANFVCSSWVFTSAYASYPVGEWVVAIFYTAASLTSFAWSTVKLLVRVATFPLTIVWIAYLCLRLAVTDAIAVVRTPLSVAPRLVCVGVYRVVREAAWWFLYGVNHYAIRCPLLLIQCLFEMCLHVVATLLLHTDMAAVRPTAATEVRPGSTADSAECI